MVELKTIFALSSGSGRAGVAVIRVSGRQSATVIQQLCGSLPVARRASLRKFRDFSSGEILDEGLVLWMPGPGTVTGEDMAEFHVHGSPAGIAAILQCLSRLEGCVLAAAGEFTRRGFDNGRIDLVEAEGLSDLLAAETDLQRRQAMRQFLGEASSCYLGWRKSALSALAMIEASIDFVEEDGVAEAARFAVGRDIDGLLVQLREALARSDAAGLVRDGVHVVIAGPPNAGKSSLLNWFCKRDAAIVSSVAGTTRDIVEVRFVMAGVPVILSDTAGLREATGDEIEKIGMARTAAAMAASDILIWLTSPDVLDGASPVRTPDILVFNKSDLADKGMAEYMIRMRNDSGMTVSVKTGAGLSELSQRLTSMVQNKLASSEAAIVVRERHRVAISESIRILNDIDLSHGLPLELAAESLREVTRILGSITGHVNVEEVLGEIFSAFCIGK